MDIKSVLLNKDYHVVDDEGNNDEDFGKYIEVSFFKMWTSPSSGIGKNYKEEL